MDQAELHRSGAIAELPSMDQLWMPFTANRQFKAAPRLLVSATGMYYRSHDGRQILDATGRFLCAVVQFSERDARHAKLLSQFVELLPKSGRISLHHVDADIRIEHIGFTQNNPPLLRPGQAILLK